MIDFIIYTDGGSRGNPGEAALGFVIKDGSERILKEHGERLGITTNNVAEYKASIAALKKLKSMIGSKRAKDSKIEVRTDSELLERQVNAKYKVKEKELIPLFIEIWNLRQDFGSVSFVHVSRTNNRGADYMVNEALDARGDQESFGGLLTQ